VFEFNWILIFSLFLFPMIIALCMLVGVLIFPAGWDSSSVKEVCGNESENYASGQCGIRWAFILAIIGVHRLYGIIYFGLCFGTRYVKLLPESNTFPMDLIIKVLYFYTQFHQKLYKKTINHLNWGNVLKTWFKWKIIYILRRSWSQNNTLFMSFFTYNKNIFVFYIRLWFKWKYICFNQLFVLFIIKMKGEVNSAFYGWQRKS